jgi:acid phosphatase type 7
LARAGVAYANYQLKEEIQKSLPSTSLAGGAALYKRILNEFYDQITAVTSENPDMVGPDNHELGCDNGGTTDSSTNISRTVSIYMPGKTNFMSYIDHARMPSDHSGGTGNFWYSFDHEMTHFI